MFLFEKINEDVNSFVIQFLLAFFRLILNYKRNPNRFLKTVGVDMEY